MSTQATPTMEGQQSAIDCAVRLRQLLDAPKAKDPGWQDETGRMASLTAVRFLNDDPVAALRDWALLSLAAVMGSKEAKKRIPRPARWAKEAPPELSTLPHADERRAALSTLSKIKAPWAAGYAERAMLDASIDNALVPEIFRWLTASAIDRATLLGTTLARIVISLTDDARLAALLKEMQKLPPVAVLESPDALAAALERLAESLYQAATARRPSGNERLVTIILTTGVGAVEKTWREMPAVLLQPATPRAISLLMGMTPSKGKQAPLPVRCASLATVSMVSEWVRRGGQDAIQHLRALMPTWVATYPDFEANVRAAAKTQPVLDGLLSTVEPPTSGTSDRESQEVLAALLPTWDAYVAELDDTSRVASISAMLDRAAGTVGVKRFGVTGDSVIYDPIDHHLSDTDGRPPSMVRVLRPGIAVQRLDGTERVIVKALVGRES